MPPFAGPPLVARQPDAERRQLTDCVVNDHPSLLLQYDADEGQALHIGGRLKSDFRYSIGIVYNTFPWPDASQSASETIQTLVQAVLDARVAHKNATLADLYDPDVMPIDLRKAHRALDQVVDRLYRTEPFTSDLERVEHLFSLEKSVAPLAAITAGRI
jgi:hypothetical protein